MIRWCTSAGVKQCEEWRGIARGFSARGRRRRMEGESKGVRESSMVFLDRRSDCSGTTFDVVNRISLFFCKASVPSTKSSQVGSSLPPPSVARDNSLNFPSFYIDIAPHGQTVSAKVGTFAGCFAVMRHVKKRGEHHAT